MLFQKKFPTVFLVNQSQLTIVQGSNVKFESCISAAIDWANEQKACEGLSKLLLPMMRQKIGELCLVLPRSMFFTKSIYLPSVDRQEIQKMVSLQINQLLPYPAQQAVWDFVVCAERNSGSDVLILAVRREAVMKYLRILASVRLFPTVVTLSSYALAGLSTTVFSTGHTALFFSDENSTEICFSDHGKFYSSRSIAYGTKDFLGEKIDDFWTQTRLTFEAQRKGFSQHGVPCGLYLMRLPANFPEGFWEQLNKISGIAWEELSIETFKKKMGQAYLSNQKILSADVVVALAILQQGIRNLNNFLPKDFKDRHNVNARRRDAIVLAGLFLATFLSLTLALSAPVVKKIQRINFLNEKLKEVHKPFLKLRKEKEIQAVIEQILGKKIAPLLLIEELYRIVPERIAFSKISVSQNNKLDLQGQAFESAAVNDLQERMTAANLFSDVRLEHTFRRTGGPLGEVVQFTIRANLETKLPSKSE